MFKYSWNNIITISIFGVILLLGVFVFWLNSRMEDNLAKRRVAPCSEFANDDVRSVPIRCLSYFTDAGK